MSLLRVTDIHSFYGPAQALFGVSFAIEPGQLVALMGRNGMGKTTTIKAIMGLNRPRSGTIEFAGQDVTRWRPFRIARAGIGLVPEGRRVFGPLTVEHNLMATARDSANANSDVAPWTLQRVYDFFPRLDERRGQLARTLSGGEQQMLAIGRALLTNPRLLILDEATEGLAPLIRLEIWEAISALKQQGLTLLVVDKNIRELATVAERGIILEKGRVAWAGDLTTLSHDESLKARYLGV